MDYPDNQIPLRVASLYSILLYNTDRIELLLDVARSVVTLFFRYQKKFQLLSEEEAISPGNNPAQSINAEHISYSGGVLGDDDSKGTARQHVGMR